jgi:hypothetical protein
LSAGGRWFRFRMNPVSAFNERTNHVKKLFAFILCCTVLGGVMFPIVGCTTKTTTTPPAGKDKDTGGTKDKDTGTKDKTGT